MHQTESTSLGVCGLGTINADRKTVITAARIEEDTSSLDVLEATASSQYGIFAKVPIDSCNQRAIEGPG